MITYLAIGHVTRDLLPYGASRPGGTALYAASAAQRLGVAAAIVTAGDQDVAAGCPAGLLLARRPAAITTTFENLYTTRGRQQWLHAAAPSLRPGDIPRAWRSAPIVHLAPVLHETPLSLVHAFPHALIGLTPQGLLRRWRAPLPAAVRFRRWEPDPALLARLAVVVLSIEDVAGDEALAAAYARHCALVAVTRGAEGATLYVHGEPTHVPAFRAHELDPTGAGDVFAAALLIGLHDGRSPYEAAGFAAAAGAYAVEGPGLVGLPDRAMVEHRAMGG